MGTMPERDDPDDEHLVPEPDDRAGEEGWTEEIRRLRRARGRRLQEVFDAFERDGEPPPA
jgi:hypothetical protein